MEKRGHDAVFSLSAGEALRRASSVFKQAGLERSREEAEILLGRITGWGRLRVITAPDRKLGFLSRVRLAAAVRRRARHEPLAYIIGRREFYGLEFTVNRAVLIPRPETELLVETALEWVQATGIATDRVGLDVLDLGTGCGCLAVTLAGQWPGARFWAVDLSPAALGLARKNAQHHGVGKQITWCRGDYWQALQGVAYNQKFDLILANPPYIATGDWPGLPPQVRLYEPRLALDGGSGGLYGFRSILTGLPGRLRSPGLLLLEIGADQRFTVERLCRASGLFHTVHFINDYRDQPRVCMALT